jgi:hypothetical protein
MGKSAVSRIVTVSVLLGSLMTGCGTGHSEASFAKEYGSFKELSAASTAVIDVTAHPRSKQVPAASDGSSGIMATVTTLTVIKVVAGSVDGAPVIQLRQFGTAGDTSSEVQPVVTGSLRYVLFVQPFTFGPGTPDTGQYAVTGAEIAYQIEGSTAHLMVPSLSPGLPATLPTSQLLTDIDQAWK